MNLDISTLHPREIFRIAIRLEEYGRDFYKAASEKSHSTHLKDTLNTLALQETEHRLTFLKLAQDMGVDVPLGRTHTHISPLTMSALTEAGIFPPPEDRSSAIASLHSPPQALRFAIKVEKGSIFFYDSAANAVKQGQLRHALKNILAQERQHLRLLEAELKTLKAT